MLVLALALPTIAHASPVTFYTITDLGPLRTLQSAGFAVNDGGNVVGRGDGPVRWSASMPESLGTLPSAQFTGWAQDINASGLITGWADDAAKAHRAFIWDAISGMQSLGTLPGYSSSEGHGINSQGWVAGTVYEFGTSAAFVWNGSTLLSLGTLPGGTSSAGYAINDAGWVTGTADSQAMVWNGTSMVGIGVLPGYAGSTGRDINNAGVVIGTSSGPGSPDEGFVWDGSTMTGLGFLPGDNRSAGNGLNDLGQMVGQSIGLGPISINGRAVLWEDGNIYDLNTLIVGPNPFVTLRAATDISNTGLITGYAALPNGLDHAFLLTPVPTAIPEPGTLLMLGSGLLAAVRAKRRA